MNPTREQCEMLELAEAAEKALAACEEFAKPNHLSFTVKLNDGFEEITFRSGYFEYTYPQSASDWYSSGIC